MLYKNVYDAICLNPKIKYSQLEDNLGIGTSSIHRAIGWLKENGYINAERSKVKGVWQIEKWNKKSLSQPCLKLSLNLWLKQ